MVHLVRTFDPRHLVLVALLSSGCGAARQHAKLQAEGEAMRVELAETYIDKGYGEAAIPLLRRALAANPKDVKVRVLYATVLRDLGLYPQAEAQFKVALKLSPRYAPAHAGLGILYDLQREPKRALAHHRRAVKLAPGEAAYHNNLGFSLFVAGDTAGAIAELELALGLDPALIVAYNNLGFAYGRRGDYDRAERSFRTVGNRPAALLNMSLVYEDRGEGERATELREEAYVLAPDLRPSEELHE